MLNKKMLLSVLIIGVVASVAGAGTWAWFYDAETSNANTLTMGTLDLVLTEGSTWSFSPNQIGPGGSSSASVTLTNGGNIDGYLFAKVTKNGNQELIDVAVVTISDGTTTHTVNLAPGNYYGFGKIGNGKTITVTCNIPETAGNEIQGESMGITLDFLLNQQESTTPSP